MRGIRADSEIWQALDAIARQPVANAVVLARETGVSRVRNVYPFIKTLGKSGTLKGKADYYGARLYRSSDVL